MWNNNTGCGCGQKHGYDQNNCGCKPQKKEFICFEKKEDKCYKQEINCCCGSKRD